MAWNFGDSFDLYAAAADMGNGYWDSAASGSTLQSGRFSGSRALAPANSATAIVKTSGVNDPVHHFALAIYYPFTLSGTTAVDTITLYDGTTAQCTIVFRQDGLIILQAGLTGGAALATYTPGVLTATWYAFEFEVSINSTTGVFNVRKNGNTVNDFSATGLNTQASANAYANKIVIGESSPTVQQYIDDFFWRSGAATGSWLGDIRCYARMPTSDQSIVFSRSPVTVTQTVATVVSNLAVTAGRAMYAPFTANYTGTIGSATVTTQVGYTGNMKCSIYASAAGAPTTVLGSATPIANPASATPTTFTFPTPVNVVAGTQYWIAFDSDTSSGFYSNNNGSGGFFGTTAYASFPAASPTGLSAASPVSSTVNITPSNNYPYVAEPQQDGLTTYVYDSTPGDADFYGIGAIGSTPASVIAVTTRGYMQKSDAGARTAAVQLKSGGTTVASPTLALSSSGFLWSWRTDVTDPNTGAAWTAAAVNGAQIGPTVIA